MLKQLVLLTGILFSVNAIQSQSLADTILVYDIATQTTSTILPVPFNTTVPSDFTSSSYGNMGNVPPTILSLSPPTTNLFSGSNFNFPQRASYFFAPANYPARTAVRLNKYYNDSIDAICTGMILGPCLVLTSAASVHHFNIGPGPGFLPFDSIRVSPFYDNGLAQTSLPTTVVKKVYMFKTFYDQDLTENVALLELKDPIGSQLGWTGIGFNTDPNFTTNKVFHKFSYPINLFPGNPALTPTYNGDTLYYNYGRISDGNYYTVNSGVGFNGQDGSTFMYTDNINYYSVGLFSYAGNYTHYKITNAAFYRLKNIMTTLGCNSITTSLKNTGEINIHLSLYPNPMRDISVLEFDYNPLKQYKLQLINSFGIVVRTIYPNSNKVLILRESLIEGFYTLHLSNDKGEAYTDKLLVD